MKGGKHLKTNNKSGNWNIGMTMESEQHEKLEKCLKPRVVTWITMDVNGKCRLPRQSSPVFSFKNLMSILTIASMHVCI